MVARQCLAMEEVLPTPMNHQCPSAVPVQTSLGVPDLQMQINTPDSRHFSTHNSVTSNRISQAMLFLQTGQAETSS